MIPKDVVICDWHYERPDKTAVYFAMKGFTVVTYPWRNGDIAVQQLRDMIAFRQHSSDAMKPLFNGLVQTVWSRNDIFLKNYYENRQDTLAGDANKINAWDCFRQLYDEINKL